MMSLLVARMYHLQIFESSRYRKLADENRISQRLDPPARGEIFDRKGDILVDNKRRFRLVAVREQIPNLEAVLQKLHRLSIISRDDMQQLQEKIRAGPSFVPVCLRESLGWEEVSAIAIHVQDLPGIAVQEVFFRNYRYGVVASHVLGYIGSPDPEQSRTEPLLRVSGFGVGVQGIESRYDHILRGRAGHTTIEVNAHGRIMRELGRKPEVPGRDLALTLDGKLQEFVSKRMQNERSAAVVVLDAQTGDVLSLVSSPGYDPNWFVSGMTDELWKSLLHDDRMPFLNKAIAGLYAPGSTFKIVVALAALEDGFDSTHVSHCPGSLQISDTKLHCWKAHGGVDLPKSIQQSCDVYFYRLARLLGMDKIAGMARKLGLGRTCGIDIAGEKSGVIPDSNWKNLSLGRTWHLGETMIAGIGQGAVLCTPLQLAVMTARVATGKQVRPRTLLGVRAMSERFARTHAFSTNSSDQQGRFGTQEPLGISEKHLTLVRQAMQDVCNTPKGTAFGARIVAKGMEMGGKTGTSQVRRITKQERENNIPNNVDLPWKQRDHALFVGYAPVDKPRYVCAVVVEHGGSGSRQAAPVGRDILLWAQKQNALRLSAYPVEPAPPHPAFL